GRGSPARPTFQTMVVAVVSSGAAYQLVYLPSASGAACNEAAVAMPALLTASVVVAVWGAPRKLSCPLSSSSLTDVTGTSIGPGGEACAAAPSVAAVVNVTELVTGAAAPLGVTVMPTGIGNGVATPANSTGSVV